MSPSTRFPNRLLRLFAAAAIAMAAAGGAAAAVAQAPPQYGVVAYLNPANVAAFDLRHATVALRLNPNRDLYLITSTLGLSDQQLLSDIETDPAATGAEVNGPVSLDDPSLDGGQSTASVLNGGQSTASVLNGSGSSTSTGTTSSTGLLGGLLAPNTLLGGIVDPVVQLAGGLLDPLLGNVLNLNISVSGTGPSISTGSTAVINSTPTWYYGAVVPGEYVSQPMVGQVQSGPSAQNLANGSGVTVALIDNGLDPSNPVLAQTWNGEPGWNFYDNSPDWSAYADLAAGPGAPNAQLDGQSTASVLNGQSTASVLNGSTCAAEFGPSGSQLDQSTASVLNGGQSTASVLNNAQTQQQALAALNLILACDPDFGHGTSVAGLIHLVAPDAKILPIKAFGPGGTATVAAIYQSITYAVDHHVQVINMSFSAQATTPVIQAAVQEAVNDGIIVVAAAGNAASDAAVYPASLPGVVGVGAVDGTQAQFPLASFSNFDPGPGQVVDAAVAAPGVQLFTTYPGAGQIWATVNGTSFSTPLVAGEAALLSQLRLSGAAARNAIANAADPAIAGDGQGQIGHGLIDILQAVQSAAPSWGWGWGW
jgi:subtilisin family serine protease